MIKEKRMFTVICDRCGADALAESEYSCWESEDVAIDDAVDNWDYQIIDGKHFCPECWTWSDDEEIIIKP